MWSWKKVGVIFPFILDSFYFISNAKNFFIHSLNRFKKNAFALQVFFNLVPYMQISDMIVGVNIMGGKVSVASFNRAGSLQGVQLHDLWFIFYDSIWNFHGSYFSRKHVFHESYRVNRTYDYGLNTSNPTSFHLFMSKKLFKQLTSQIICLLFDLLGNQQGISKNYKTCFLRNFQYLIHVWSIIFCFSYQTYSIWNSKY